MILKIACIQMDIAFGNPKVNFQKANQLIDEAVTNNPDIIVLPELWTTGYDLTRLDEIGDANSEQTLRFLKAKAAEHQVHFIGGSVADKREDGTFNTLLIINKNGEEVHHYSKLHLFQLMDEHLYLAPGTKKGLFQLENQTFAGMICYDIRFPEWIRSHTSEGAETLFVVAEWPLPRLSHWRALLIARAIENQCYVVACNRSGSDPKNKFAGHSMIIDPWGEVIAESGEGEDVLVGDIDMHKVKEVRKLIPIISDRRPDFY